MVTPRCIRLYISFTVVSSLLCFPANYFLVRALSSEVVGSAESNTNSPNVKASCIFRKFVAQSYYERYKVLVDLDFDSFMSQEVPCGLCKLLPETHKLVLRVSDLQRNLVGEGSHRHLSTSIKFQTQHSVSERSNDSCQLIIIERLPRGVFADPFELQHLVQRGVYGDVAVFGDTNLELPSFLSNRSAVEIHFDVDPNILLEQTNIDVELSLHARYQPLNESGYSTVKFGAPDMLLRCSTKGNEENHRCCFIKIVNDDANLNGADIVWNIPAGRKAHAELVSLFTFISALLSTLLIVWTSLGYSNIRLRKTLKQV